VPTRETREETQLLTPDGKRSSASKNGPSGNVAVQRSRNHDRVAPIPGRTGLETVQFRKDEKPAPDAGPDRQPRSSSTSLAIFLALVGLVALIILVLVM
jgi:hypothetical protein